MIFLMCPDRFSYLLFFFNDTATTEIYTLSLHDALPILFFIGTLFPSLPGASHWRNVGRNILLDHALTKVLEDGANAKHRSEEHTSELQSRLHLVCRLLLEKKKKEK